MLRSRAARVFATLLVVALLTIAGSAAASKPEKEAAIGHTYDRNGVLINELDQPIQTNGTRLFGTIQYDTGVVTGTPGAPLVSFMVGNQFNTPVTPNGTVTQVQFYINTAGGSAAYVSMYGPPVGNTAPKITTFNFTGVGSGFNTVNFTAVANQYTGPSFLLGIWLAGTTADVVGLDSNDGGMGFHGIAIDDNYPAPTGTNFQTIGSVNAIVRPTGNIVVPVELMSFSVDGE